MHAHDDAPYLPQPRPQSNQPRPTATSPAGLSARDATNRGPQTDRSEQTAPTQEVPTRPMPRTLAATAETQQEPQPAELADEDDGHTANSAVSRGFPLIQFGRSIPSRRTVSSASANALAGRSGYQNQPNHASFIAALPIRASDSQALHADETLARPGRQRHQLLRSCDRTSWRCRAHTERSGNPPQRPSSRCAQQRPVHRADAGRTVPVVRRALC